MLSINIRTIPHNEQRYDTVGDYWEENNGRDLEVRVSQMSDWRYELLVVVHEVVEFFLCRHAGIKEPDIKAFDEEFERQRALGVHSQEAEPGDHKDAPYRQQHRHATVIEFLLAMLIGVDWIVYSKEVETFSKETPKIVPERF